MQLYDPFLDPPPLQLFTINLQKPRICFSNINVFQFLKWFENFLNSIFPVPNNL